MTRIMITELVIRLLAIWLFINSLGSIFPIYESTRAMNPPFYAYIIIFLLPISISLLFIVFSKQIARIIWTGRQNDIEIITQKEENDTFIALISILGLYLIIYSISTIINHLSGIVMTITSHFGPGNKYSYLISEILHNGMILAFGILLFIFPEKIMSIRISLKDFLIGSSISDDSQQEKE